MISHTGPIVTLRVSQSLQLHVIQKISRSSTFFDHRVWPDKSMIWIELDVIFFMVNTQAIVNGVVKCRSISIEGALKVMRYLMREETSIRSDFSRYYEFVVVW